MPRGRIHSRSQGAGRAWSAPGPAASFGEAAEVGERLRRVVRDTVIRGGEQEVRVTVSGGAIAFPEVDVADETAMVGLADRALHRAKDAGRNQVVV